MSAVSPLETVVIRSELVICPGFVPILPWVRLTHISVTAWIWASNVVEIQQICPNLKSGDFSILTNGMLFVQGPPNLAMVHKNMEELRLDFCLRSLCPLALGAKVIFSTKKMHFPHFSLSNSKNSLLFGVPSILHIEISVPHISFDFFEPKSSDCDVIFWIPKM